MDFVKNNFHWIALVLLVLIFFGVNSKTVQDKLNSGNTANNAGGAAPATTA